MACGRVARVIARPWLAAAVPCIALLELIAVPMVGSWVPARADWARLRSVVQAFSEPGTLVLVTPRWAEPLARAALPTGMLPAQVLARADEEGFETALEIALGGERSPELKSWKLLETTDSGPFTLRRWRNPDFRPQLFDFVGELGPATASVIHHGRDAEEACIWMELAPRFAGGLGGPPAFPAQRFQCAVNDFVFAGVTIIDDQDYRPRRCVWAHPPPQGALTVTYRGVPLGEKIVGHLGIPWLPARDGLGTPVTLRVTIDGRTAREFAYDEREGWKRFEFATGVTPGQLHEVTWWVQSERFDFRHFCFEARAR